MNGEKLILLCLCLTLLLQNVELEELPDVDKDLVKEIWSESWKEVEKDFNERIQHQTEIVAGHYRRGQSKA
jgi:hypothetical protein